MSWSTTPEVHEDGMRLWTKPGSEGDALVPLLRRATSALMFEDNRLREALSDSAAKQNYTTCGHGLSYWVFEHNLVYPIFLAWVRTHHVRWDEPAMERVEPKPLERGEPASRKEAKGDSSSTRSLVDLQLALEPGNIVRLEAKWWMLNNSRHHVEADANKLKRICKSFGGRAVLLTFWYGLEDARASEMEDALTKAPGLGAEMFFAGTFRSSVYPSWLKNKPSLTDAGYFTLAALEVDVSA